MNHNPQLDCSPCSCVYAVYIRHTAYFTLCNLLTAIAGTYQGIQEYTSETAIAFPGKSASSGDDEKAARPKLDIWSLRKIHAFQFWIT